MEDKIFNIIGTYFTNCFWKDLYDEAIECYKNKQYHTIKNSYIATINRYTRAFCYNPGIESKKNNTYRKIISHLYSNYSVYTKVSCTEFEFIRDIIKLMIPEEFLSEFQSSTYEEIFRSLMSKVLTNFANYISNEEIDNFININSNDSVQNNDEIKKNMAQWRDKFVEIMVHEKLELISILNAYKNGVDVRNPVEAPKIHREFYEKTQNTIKLLLEEKVELQKKVNNCMNYITELKKRFANLQSENNFLKAQNQTLMIDKGLVTESSVIEIKDDETDVDFGDSLQTDDI